MNDQTETSARPQPGQDLVSAERSALPSTIGKVGLVERGYIAPTNAEEAYELARLLESVAGNSFGGNINKIAVAILAGQEAGLPPVYSVMNIAIINGRPSMWGDAILALIQASGLLEDFRAIQIGSAVDTDRMKREEWPDDFGYSVTMKRKGQETPYVGRFTVGDAKRAGLWMNTKKVPWFEHPLTMLERRAMGKPARKGFADVLAGLSIREEIEDYHVEPDTAEQQQRTASLLIDDDEPEPIEPEQAEEPAAGPDQGESEGEAGDEPQQPSLLPQEPEDG